MFRAMHKVLPWLGIETFTVKVATIDHHEGCAAAIAEHMPEGTIKIHRKINIY